MRMHMTMYEGLMSYYFIDREAGEIILLRAREAGPPLKAANRRTDKSTLAL